MIRFCFCALAIASASAGDIDFDLEKLADFSTGFEYNLDSDSLSISPVPFKSKINGKGSLQVDVKEARFRIAARTHYDLDNDEVETVMTKGKGKGKAKGSTVGIEHASITFSVPGKFVSMRFWEEVSTKDTGMDGSAELAGCALINFPAMLVDDFKHSVGGDYQASYERVGQKLKSLEGILNGAPHDEEIIDGKTVEVFKDPLFLTGGEAPDAFLYTGMEPDGSPFGIGFQSDLSDPLIKFTDFKKGAGDIEEMSCKKIPTMEFLAHPKAPKSLAILGQLVKTMRKNPVLEKSLEKIPKEFTNFFIAAAGTESARPICLAAPPPQTNFVGLVVAAIAGGAIGAAVLLLVARQMVKRQVSLLS